MKDERLKSPEPISPVLYEKYLAHQAEMAEMLHPDLKASYDALKSHGIPVQVHWPGKDVGEFVFTVLLPSPKGQPPVSWILFGTQFSFTDHIIETWEQWQIEAQLTI